MAGTVDTDSEADLYALFGVDSDASSKQIRTAYRQKSLKVHPDRNPDNPEAANLFHQLSIAHELLIDPVRREAYDKIYKARQARKERFSALDSKKRSMAADLNAREEAFKKQRTEDREASMREAAELNRLRAEGEKMRREREERIHREATQRDNLSRQAEAQSGPGADDLGPLDTTVRLKWLRKQYPALELDGGASIYDILPIPRASVDNVLVSGKMASNPKLKYGSAVISLHTLSAAIKLVESAGKDNLQSIEVTWAAGEEPLIVRRSRGSTGGNMSTFNGNYDSVKSPAAKTQATIPTQLDEDSVLAALRARERERARIEEEIRRQDAEEDAANGQ